MAAPDAVIAEFERTLAAWREELAGDPKQLLTRLWLLALERERMVTVAYRRDAIVPRLAAMQLPSEGREVIADAIRWAWRDEEAHALWIRGALLQDGSLPERLRAWMTQVEGQLGGWTSSRQHHLRWHEAPVTRAAAELLELAGAALGKVPPAVRTELRFATFRAFCTFSLAAERTAALGWATMAQVAREPRAGARAGDVDAFLRMEEDENRHAALFATLAEAFSEEDQLQIDVATLRARVGAVGQRFLAVPEDGATAWSNPLGKGSDVFVARGASTAHRTEVLQAVLADVGLAGILEAHPGARVAVKTTFMLVTDRRDLSPGVSPLLLHGLVAWLEARGASVRLIDARNVYDRFHGGRSVREVAAYLGLGGLDVVDAQEDQVPHRYLRGLGQQTICRTWRDADLRLAFGKLRGHPTAMAMQALETVEGLGSRHDHHVFGDRQADREVAIMMILDAFPPHLTLLDAFEAVPDGLLGMMGRRDPLQPLRLYGARDAVALDAVVARHVGADPEDERTLCSVAFDWFGDPRPRTRVRGPDLPIPGWRAPDQSQRSALLSRLALPVYTHASARGALFVPEVDTRAFPLREPPSAALRLARSAVRALIGPTPAAQAPAPLLPVRWEQVDGRPLRAVCLGAGTPVLMLHGYPETCQLFGPLARALAPRWQVWTFDWPGQGHSPAWPGPATPSALANQVARLLDHWALGPVHLVATDMGGPPALVLAARQPERVRSVTVLNSLLFADGATSWEIAVMRRSGLQSAAFGLAPRLVYRQCQRTFLPPDRQLPAAVDADFLASFRDPSVRRHIVSMCRDYEAELPALPASYWQVDRPVLALWGTAEAHFPVDQAERLVGLIQGARLERIDGGTHWMAWTEASRVAARIEAHLTGEASGSGQT